MTTHDHGASATPAAGGASFLVKDPVCGMDVDPHQSAGHVEHEGRTYYFCSTHCQARFEAAPEDYLRSGPAPSPSTTDGVAVEYTCPMHPEIVREEPGACPICGMALEPRTVTVEEPPNSNLAPPGWYLLFILDASRSPSTGRWVRVTP